MAIVKLLQFFVQKKASLFFSFNKLFLYQYLNFFWDTHPKLRNIATSSANLLSVDLDYSKQL